jgi:RHS repeat-associated protein
MKHHTPRLVAASLPLGSLGCLVFALLTLSPAAQALTQTRTSSFEYDTQGLLKKEIVEPLTVVPLDPNNCLQTSYTYDAFGNKATVSTATCAGGTAPATTSATVARTASTSFGTDGRFPVTSTNALNQSETKLFDARFGTITSLTGPNGLTTTWQYDTFGRKTRETRADATYTTWAYKLCTDAGANCPGPIAGATIIGVTVEQSYAANAAINAPEKRQYLDTLNRAVRVQTQGFDGTTGQASPVLVQDTEYNALGQAVRQSNLYALVGGTPVWSTTTYDAMGRTLTQTVPDATVPGGTVTATFAYNGLTVTATNAKNQTKTTTKNAQGQVALVTDSEGQTVAYTYDALGQLTETNAAGSITKLQYNQRGQKIAMQDPAMGSWIYSYNAFGELVSQRDSLNQTTTMVYDVLGRMTQRTEPDLVSDWSYDKNFAGVACGKGIGKLCEAKSNNGYNRTHTYDTLGRIITSATVLDSATTPATVSETFDANTGRVTSKTWPTGYTANYSYTALGYLKTVSAGGTTAFPQVVSHTILAMNAQGQVTQYKTGNNVTTVKTFAPDTGRLNSQTATLDGQAAGNVLNQSYTYDALGNLISRADNSPNVGTSESFSYDSLNRLTLSTLVGGAVMPSTTTQVMYDARGNITYKSDVGRYWYDAARPNRMTQVTLETAPGAIVLNTGTRALSYAFDDLKTGSQTINSTKVGNGNLEYTVSQDTTTGRHNVRYESYTSFAMPLQITLQTLSSGALTTTGTGSCATGVVFVGSNKCLQTTALPVADRTLSFVYGPEHQRIKQNIALTSNGTSAYFAGNVWYLNGEDSLGLSYEKEIRANGTTEHKHYLKAAGITFALFTSRTGTLNGLPATSTSYFHHDQLGSISAITNELGAVVERLAYDPWGKRRFINTTPGATDKLDAIVGIKTDRGFTEHEHLDEMGVVHMNGRIYDPLIGRFMSADPFIQAPDNLQSYNRYAYVMNNPLTLTDPSGYFWGYVVAIVAEVAHQAGVISERDARTIQGIALAFEGHAWAKGAGYGAVGAGAVGGAINGFVSSNGNLQATVQGSLTGAAFGWAGGLESAAANYAAHAAIGCASSVAGGGSCQSGATSALFGKFATNQTASWGVGVAQGVAAVVAGGVGSVIAGGKFENGAKTAAYGYLFNCLAHDGCNMKSEGYKETAYRDGTYCNIQGSPSCGSPQGAGANETWTFGYSESAKMSIRAGGYAGEYNIDSMEPTFAGMQVGGPSYKLTDTRSYGYTSGEYAPMVKANFSLGYLVGGDVGLSFGFNGIKASLSVGGGTFGQVSGRFPQQQVVYGGGPSLAAGMGKQ